MARKKQNARRQSRHCSPQTKGPQASCNEINSFAVVRFGKENRVRLARDFAYLKQHSKKADCSAFVFYCLPRPENSVSRLGLVTGKRVGCAVERNRARRVLRAVFRDCAPSFPIPCDILVFVRRGFSKFDYARLREKFARAAEKIISDAQNRK